jgi:hypothetical protein
MALVEKFHVVAAERAVASGQTIKEGQCVALNTYGEVVLESASFGMTYGIAGDTKSTTASAMPGVASGWQNRVSDYFDETKASGKMTVYHSGGEFATDQFATNVSGSLCQVWSSRYIGRRRWRVLCCCISHSDCWFVSFWSSGHRYYR